MIEFLSMLSCFSPVHQAVHQAPLSMCFSRQEYWRGLLFPPPGNLLNPGMEPMSFKSPALAGGFFTTKTTWEFPGRIL